jgi:lipopolysaccharide/colanic/teichoic acid biosynthesis glycosyltransferase
VSTPPTITGSTPTTAAVPLPRHRPSGPRHLSARWQDRYAAIVRAADLGALAGCVTGGLLVLPRVVAETTEGTLAGGAAAFVLAGAALAAGRAWEPVVLGTGPTEIRRLLRAVFAGAVALALAGLALQVDDVVRPWVFGVLPAYAVVAVVLRHALRRWLYHQRSGGRFQLPVLAVGSHEAVAHLIARTRRDPHFGWTVTGACTSTGAGLYGSPDINGVPVVGDLESAPAAVRASGYRVVVVAPGPGWGPRRLHELAWQLEGTRTELAVDPGLMELGGPRLQLTPVDSMPLVTLTKPRLSGGRRMLKDVCDKVGASVLLAVAALPMLVIALAVRLDGGPAICRELRMGEGGRLYGMSRFRVTDDATRRRLTRVGRLLQRFSLDELPQLLDVLTGSMSLVGPRPPRPEEMAGADVEAMRRLLVRPGMTGLWQIMRDREHVSWDDSVRLDLRYVENWSLTLDVAILLRTARSLVHRARTFA